MNIDIHCHENKDNVLLSQFMSNSQFVLVLYPISLTSALFHYSYNTIAASCSWDIQKMSQRWWWRKKIQPKFVITTLWAILFKLSLSEARVWSAGSQCLQLHHSSIIEGHFTNEWRSALLFICHCLPQHPFFSVSFYSSLLPSHHLACSRMWRERRTCQCYQHATDDSFEGDRDFQLLPQWLITHTPHRVDPHLPLCKTNHQAMGGQFCMLEPTPVLTFLWDTFNVGHYLCWGAH